MSIGRGAGIVNPALGQCQTIVRFSAIVSYKKMKFVFFTNYCRTTSLHRKEMRRQIYPEKEKEEVKNIKFFMTLTNRSFAELNLLAQYV